MKSVSKKHIKKSREYPKLMQCTDSGLILLMIGDRVGTVVHGCKPSNVGMQSNAWNHETLIDYEGTIELSND